MIQRYERRQPEHLRRVPFDEPQFPVNLVVVILLIIGAILL